MLFQRHDNQCAKERYHYRQAKIAIFNDVCSCGNRVHNHPLGLPEIPAISPSINSTGLVPLLKKRAEHLSMHVNYIFSINGFIISINGNNDTDGNGSLCSGNGHDK